MIPTGARVWIALGHTDMRRGMQSLAAMVQHHFAKDPFAGDLWVFRGRSGSLVKIIWHGHVDLREAARTREVRLALRQGRRGVAYELSTRLPARWYRLAQPAVFVAATERRLACKVGAFSA